MKILVMRPSPEGKELANNLNQINIPSWHFSFFNFYPSFSSMSLSNKINKLYQANVILVFSKQAVYYTDIYLQNHNLKWPSNVKYYAIGHSTAFYLHQYVKKKLFFLKKKKIVKVY